MELDPEGWLEIDALIKNSNAIGNAITLEELREVVAACDKQRFALSDDGLRIRANQGHSVSDIELNLVATNAPELLYHGTVEKFLGSIRNQGLRKRKRHHVHLSADRTTATKVGSRRGEPVILTIAAGKMHDAGYEFFLSNNGVWLTDAVPTQFIDFPA